MSEELTEEILIAIAKEESLALSQQQYESDSDTSSSSSSSEESFHSGRAGIDDDDISFQYALQLSMESPQEIQPIPAEGEELNTFSRSLSQEHASSLALVHLSEAMSHLSETSSNTFPDLPNILTGLHLALSELDHVFQGLGEHYEQWMIDLILERQNLEEVQRMLQQEKVELEEVVRFVGRLIENKAQERAREEAGLRACQERARAADRALEREKRGSIISNVVTSVIATSLLFLPIPGSRIAAGAIFGLRAGVGGLQIANSFRDGRSRVSGRRQFRDELHSECSERQQRIDEASAEFARKEEEKLMKEAQLAWKNFDLEEHFKTEESHGRLRKRVAETQTLVRTVGGEMSALESKAAALMSTVGRVVTFSPFRRLIISGQVLELSQGFFQVCRRASMGSGQLGAEFENDFLLSVAEFETRTVEFERKNDAFAVTLEGSEGWRRQLGHDRIQEDDDFVQ